MSEHLNKIPKETLTLQNIKQDIKELYKPSITTFLVLAILSTILLSLASVFWDGLKIMAIFLAIIGILGVVAGIYALFIPIIGRKITNKNLVIVEDWLVEINEKVEHGGQYSRAYYEFCFAKGAKFILFKNTTDFFENRHYKWSKMYNMSTQGIYNYSHVDDDFYLVFSNEKKSNLILIYNKKLFELE